MRYKRRRGRIAGQRRLSGSEQLEQRLLLTADIQQWWQPLDQLDQSGRTSYLGLAEFSPIVVDQAYLTNALDAVEHESQAAGTNTAGLTTIELPAPDGTTQRFSLLETDVLAPELAAELSTIGTYCGQGIDDPNATVRLDISENGLNVQVLTAGGSWYIAPYFHQNSSVHAVYTRGASVDIELPRIVTSEGVSAESTAQTKSKSDPPPLAQRPVGDELRIVPIAISATGEYTTFHGGTISGAAAAITTAVTVRASRKADNTAPMIANIRDSMVLE